MLNPGRIHGKSANVRSPSHVGAGKSRSAGTSTSYSYDVNASLPVLLDDGVHKYVWGLGLAFAVDASGNSPGYQEPASVPSGTSPAPRLRALTLRSLALSPFGPESVPLSRPGGSAGASPSSTFGPAPSVGFVFSARWLQPRARACQNPGGKAQDPAIRIPRPSPKGIVFSARWL